MADVEATRTERLTAGGIAVFLIVFSVAGLIFGKLPGPQMPAAIAAYGTAVLILDVSTALLLGWQARLRNDARAAGLAGVYVFSGILAPLFFFVLLDFISAAPARPGEGKIAAWLWMAWHGCMPLLSCLTLVAGDRPGRGILLCFLIPGILAPLVILAFILLCSQWLPIIVTSGRYDLLDSPHGLALIAIAGAAVLFAFRWTRGGRSTIELGLLLALFANFLDILVTAGGYARFSFGWYFSKIESLMASGLVLAALQVDVFRLSYKLREANLQLEALSRSDSLTGLANRRAFDEILNIEWARARHSGNPLTMFMVDVDHFKNYNDRYGHQAGDRCLQEIAQVLKSAARRAGDVCARYGGEEFAIILPDTEPEVAAQIAETIRAKCQRLAILHEDTDPGVVTISLGVVTIRTDASSSASLLIETADKALYRAKKSGRNRVVIAPSPFEEPHFLADEARDASGLG